jgi:hypothetical protein
MPSAGFTQRFLGRASSLNDENTKIHLQIQHSQTLFLRRMKRA